MVISHRTFILLCNLLCFFGTTIYSNAQSVYIRQDRQAKRVEFGNEKMSLTLDYNKKANIALFSINGQQIIQGPAGVYTKIRTSTTTYSTLQLFSDPVIYISGQTIRVQDIRYGDKDLVIEENWTFTISEGDIRLDMDRNLSRGILAEQVAFPAFIFQQLDTWEGAYQDYGGLAWFYLFNKVHDTYGVHSSSSRFWNSQTGNGLTIAVEATGKQVAMDYSRTPADQLAFSIGISQDDIMPRFDADTKRRRFVRDTTAVWAPVQLRGGKSSQTITFTYFDFEKTFGRGNLKGINKEQVSAVLNTIARIGVIDKQHFGGNSWHTPYGPICLHEQYIAQMGLAINDPYYLSGYQQCLDFYRDQAIMPDGRVWPRWAYSNEDAMPGVFTDKGFYEAQWGYLLDSNPDLVTNVAELYDQTGDLAWVKTHQLSCEKALEWIMKRDSNDNGLVEMITDSHLQKRGSDWIDIIWAAYENAFVNAKLYHALVLWADIERQLGNASKQQTYLAFAGKLKTSFNLPVSKGGFWDDEKKCYIHWREKDGTGHGNNMVTPVNFMAIAYDICDDKARTKTILDQIERQMQQEQLFFWPICLYSYAPGEGNDWQFPFPNYENGDLFLSWGAVGVKAYAAYDPGLALKYVKNVLAQYAKDGLAFQRYGRAKQDGLGDDILSGNSLSVVGLYQSVYGINPLYNRLYLDPHITGELAGTQIFYLYRGQQLSINLDMQQYAVSNNNFKIISGADFGFSANGEELLYFHGKNYLPSLMARTQAQKKLTLQIHKWEPGERHWTHASDEMAVSTISYQINDLVPENDYTIFVNHQPLKSIRSNQSGELNFDCEISITLALMVISTKKD